jgi:predicted nucleic acid-binding protein
MNQTFVADASPLIVLQNIGELSLLEKLFGEIIVTPEVAAEYGIELPVWIKTANVQDKTKQAILNLFLGRGEAAAIALCLETASSVLIIDEKKGRRVAKDLGIKIVGTLGVIVKAKEAGLINSPADILSKLENAKFRISPNLKKKILENE